MSFTAQETSRTGGKPYQLLHFRSGSEDFRYTTTDHAITVGAVVYTADNPMQSVEIKETNVDDKGKLNFKVMRDHEIAQLFLISTPRTIGLTIFGGHENDTAGELITLWTGRVVACEWDEEDTATLSCESMTTILQRNGLPYNFGNTCQHSLYRGGCNLNMFDNSMLVPVSSVDGYTITFTDLIGYPDNEYVGGLIILDGVDYRMVTVYDRDTGTMTLIRPFESVDVGTVVRVARGCDRTSARCEELGNFVNYLGFDTVPNRNPFEGLRQAQFLNTKDSSPESGTGFLGNG